MTTDFSWLALVLCIYSCIDLYYCKECNVLDYGAKGDGINDDTIAIQDTINKCYNDSNTNQLNSIIFSSNHQFMIYPIFLTHSNIELLIESNASINAIPNITSWPVNITDNAVITLITGKPGIENITIRGISRDLSMINGNGEIWYNNKTTKHNRPTLIRLSGITNIKIHDLTFLNSPSYFIILFGDRDIEIYNINITSPDAKIAPNTDGLDIGSENVHIYNSYISNGDDGYCLKG